MSAPRLPPPPTDGFLQWALQHPDEVAAYLRAVYELQALRDLTIAVVVNGQRKTYAVELAELNAIVEIRIDT